MNERINNLRLDAGISQLKDDPRLVVIDREGNVIDPLIGLEKFAELIVKECCQLVEDTPGVAWDDIELIIKTIQENFGIQRGMDV